MASHFLKLLLFFALCGLGSGAALAKVASQKSLQLQLGPEVPTGMAQGGGMVPTEASPAVAPRPMLFFLFLVYVKINNEDVWNRFFYTARRGIDYRAFVHCKDEAECRKNIREIDRYEIIPSVETQYCFDLVSGMNELLRAAVQEQARHANDKFVFVSDSTVPLKPFSYIQNRLTVEDGQTSNFCIFPRNEWAEVADPAAQAQGSMKVGVKHHQWMVLNRQHAQISINRTGELMNLMQVFQLNMGYRNTGCLDEFWHFATLYAWLHLGQQAATVNFMNLGGGPLRTDVYEIQGRCDTFVFWPPRAAGTNNNITNLAHLLGNDPGTELVPPTEKRPSSISRLSRQALTHMRNSPFLFARKLDDAATFSGCHTLPEAFDGLVFADRPDTFADVEPTWVGSGMWLDTRKLPVSIQAHDGAVSVLGVAKGTDELKATGHYCNDHIDTVFSTGFSATAQVWCRKGGSAGYVVHRVPCGRLSSMDAYELHWDNGAVWTRAQGAR